MNSLIRWGKTLGLLGSAVLITLVGQTLKALALPTDEVVKILQGVPVFTLTNAQGAPLVAVDNNNKQSVIRLYVSQQEAEKTFQQLKKDKPDIASKVSVNSLSLGAMYKFAVENANKPETPKLLFVPILSEIDNASKILTAAGQKYQGGVPLYAVSVGKDKERGYIMAQLDNKKVTPFFFEQKQAQAAADEFKKSHADLASTVKIDVISLEGLVGELQKSDDQKLSSLLLWPSEESLKYIQAAIQNQGKQAPGSPKPPAPSNKK